ncbi:hypothetical protein RB600_007169 [Gaeumannomyces tritici]
MSRNHSQRPRQFADDLVRSILDDRPAAEVSPSGELYRVIERFHDNFDRDRRTTGDLSLPTGANNPDSTSVFGSTHSRNLQRRFSREPFSARDSARLPAPSPPLPPLRSHLGRRGPGMSFAGGGGGGGGGAGGGTGNNQNRSHFYRYRPSERYRPSPANASFADMDLRLDNAAPPFRALLDLHNTNQPTNPPPSPPFMSSSTHSQDQPEDSRRAKRRKIDSSDRLTSSFKGFRYGHYGQVEPGPLTMEIVSCDGGMYTEGSGPSIYAAENILKNDSSVYCTKGSRCNIVLKHQGATVFSLKELVIKAPGSNYSSPVREGMVFISMNKDELLTRTADYQIQYSRSRPSSNQRAPVLSVRHSEDGSSRVTQRRRMYSVLFDPEDTCLAAQVPPEFTLAPPPFRVTTECSEDESGSGDVGSSHYRYGRRRTPNRIGSLPFESDSGDDWAQVDDNVSEYIRTGHTLLAGDGGNSNGGSGGGGGDMSLEEVVEASQLATQEAVRAVGGALMAPHARFFIEKDKSKCTIRFDPPVSGRFILLKMWNPQLDHACNIDIQGVVAKGFAGPRYFPAVDLR